MRKTWLKEFFLLINLCVWYPMLCCMLIVYNPFFVGLPFTGSTLLLMISYAIWSSDKREKAARLEGFLNTKRQQDALESYVELVKKSRSQA